uniref:DUF4013 domain-containing protein n=1 Tax=Ammonifex degensii TaxID=42838 RepID=A0A7C2E310_9THEO
MQIERAFRFPFEGNGLGLVLIGGLINLVPILNFLCLGYAVEVMERVNNGRYDMPSWNGWGRKFVKGLGYLAISLFYLLIPLVILLGSCAGGSATRHNTLMPVFGSLGLLGLLLLLAFGFLVPMSLARYAATGSLAEGFRVGTVIKHIGAVAGGYVAAYLLSVAVYFGIGVVTIAIPFLGSILSIFLAFYAYVVVAALFADVHRKAVSALASSG